MSEQYDDTNRGALFKNERKEPGSKQPDYTGKLNVGGKEWALSAWLRKSRAGKSFMSMSISEPRDGSPRPRINPDADIPF